MFRPPPITRNLTGAEIEHFRQYGFVRLKNVVAEEEMMRLQVAMTLAVDTFDLSPAGCNLTAFSETAVAYAAGGGGRAVARPGPFCATSLAELLRSSGTQPLTEKTSVQCKPGRSLVDINVSARVAELREPAVADQRLAGQRRLFDLDAAGRRAGRHHHIVVDAIETDETAVAHDTPQNQPAMCLEGGAAL